ncbi:hypothetical protein IJJ05_02430 [Candidatus Saccharibacteria bacterium]|nr:hypothetical protein [Candidatus Saccharibacteria bacterium]
MKKSLIAGAGVATLALAAMPLAGVFAANSITDQVQIIIDTACSVGSTTSSTGTGAQLSENVTNGTLKTWEAGTAGGTIKVSCNSSNGWNIKAVGVGDDASDKTVMNAAATGTDIATGTTFSGATSYWAMKVTGTNTVTDFNSWHIVPDSATKVAGNSTMASEQTINTGYQVWVSATQEADTYTGKVQYTVSTGAGS